MADLGREKFILTAVAASACAFLSILENTAAFVVAPPTCPVDMRQASQRPSIVEGGTASQLRHGVGAPRLDHWRRISSSSERGQRHVLFLEPEDRDKAFELLEAYIERESATGTRDDYNRVRGLVPHMRQRYWKASAKEQDKMQEDCGMDDFQFATKEYMPGLTARPWWEPNTFSWAAKLEEASPIIQEEYRAFRAQQDAEEQFRNSKEGGYTSQGWTHIPLVNAREPEAMYTTQRAQFPNTMKILQENGILANARAVLIGRQRPMSGIKMHSDGSSLIITCHLGLDVPGEEECLMWVGVDMERRAWRNNKLMCMDTSYLHWTRNNTESERIILLVMVWHPDITPKEQRVLEYLDCLIRSAAAGKPLPLQPPISVEGA